jgi:hypothetical protein
MDTIRLRGGVPFVLAASASLFFGANACGDADSSASNGPAGDASVDGAPVEDSARGDSTLVGPSGLTDGQAAAAATFIASCFSDDGINRTLQVIYLEKTTSPFRSPEVLACLAAKKNGCGAITDCLGISYSSGTACSGDVKCNGKIHEECVSPNSKLSVDCSRLGLDCVTNKFAYCGGPTRPPCEGATFTPSCDDGVPVGCEDGNTVRGPRCADFGATCEVASAGATCKGAGGACQGTGNESTESLDFEGEGCDGTKLRACLGGGLTTLDCATVAPGFTCFPSPDGGANALAYCGSAAECVPQSPWEKVPASCDGNSVVICDGGKVQKIDCTTLGFQGCAGGLCTPGLFN